MALPGIPIPETQCIGDSLFSINNALTALDTAVTAAAGSGVTKITAGTNISISPTGGTGDVTINAEGGATVTVQDTPPAGAQPGDLWFDSSSGVTSVYYDGTWVDVGGGDSGTSAGSVNGIVKSDGAGNFSAAVAGTDYLTSATLGSSPAAAKAWVNFNGAAASYTSGNTVTYVANSPSAGQTTVTIDRTATWSPLPVVGNWVTVSGVTGATAVNGTFQITEVNNVAFNIKYIVPSVVTGTVGGTADAYIVAIRSSYNVSSITKNGTGDYTVNFATAMADANYSWSCNGHRGDGVGGCGLFSGRGVSGNSYSPTINGIRVASANSSNTEIDVPAFTIQVFGN